MLPRSWRPQCRSADRRKNQSRHVPRCRRAEAQAGAARHRNARVCSRHVNSDIRPADIPRAGDFQRSVLDDIRTRAERDVGRGHIDPSAIGSRRERYRRRTRDREVHIIAMLRLWLGSFRKGIWMDVALARGGGDVSRGRNSTDDAVPHRPERGVAADPECLPCRRVYPDDARRSIEPRIAHDAESAGRHRGQRDHAHRQRIRHDCNCRGSEGRGSKSKELGEVDQRRLLERDLDRASAVDN
jgi:hypothetical protein